MRRAGGALLAVLGLAALLASCGAGTTRAAAPPGRYPDTAAQLAVSEHAAAVQASAAYRADEITAAASFNRDLGALAAAVSGGGPVAGRPALVRAERDYDALRVEMDLDPSEAALLDGPAPGPGSGTGFAGLQRVERDLWATAPGAGASDLGPATTELADQGPVASLLVSHLSVSPAGVADDGVAILGWVNAWAVPGRQEVYSHLDALDVAAGVAAARTAYQAIIPLGWLEANALTRQVGEDFEGLGAAVGALGPTASTTDSEISAATWLDLAQRIDATAATLSRLAAHLSGSAPSTSY